MFSWQLEEKFSDLFPLCGALHTQIGCGKTVLDISLPCLSGQHITLDFVSE